MNQSVLMQVQLDAGLRASFQQAAERQHQPAAEVLQWLMWDYVSRHPEPAPPPRVLDDDRDPDELVNKQYGWRDSPFGAD